MIFLLGPSVKSVSWYVKFNCKRKKQGKECLGKSAKCHFMPEGTNPVISTIDALPKKVASFFFNENLNILQSKQKVFRGKLESGANQVAVRGRGMFGT